MHFVPIWTHFESKGCLKRSQIAFKFLTFSKKIDEILKIIHAEFRNDEEEIGRSIKNGKKLKICAKRNWNVEKSQFVHKIWKMRHG